MNIMQAASVNSIEDALGRLGVTATTLSPEEKRALDEHGYLILPGLIETAWLKELRAAFEQVSAQERQVAGSQPSGTRHLEDLINQGEVFEGIYTHPKLLAAAYHVLGRPFRLFHLHGRDPLPGYGQQGLHADWMPRAAQEPFYVVTAIWLLDDFTSVNGATRLVPGTHRMKGQVPKAMADPASRHTGQILVIARAGSVLIFNGHLWHSGTRNNSGGSRRVLQCQFVAREYPRHVQIQHDAPERLAPAVRYLLCV